MPQTVIKSVRLFDGNNVHSSATVTFDSDSGTITSVSTASDVDVPQGVEVIDGSGQTLLPGLIDAHVHVHALHLPKGGDHSQVLKTPLKCGVTTICDMHSDPETIHKFRRQIKEEVATAKKNGGKIQLADLKSCLYGATIQGGWPKPIVLGHDPTEELKAIVSQWPSVTPQTAREFIASHKANEADYIKLMQENCCSLALPNNSIPVATQELQTAVVSAAHDAGLLVVAHATALESAEIVLKSGADGLTHTFIDQNPTPAIIPLYKANNAFVIPTLVVLSSLTAELQDRRDRFASLADKKGLIDSFTDENMRSPIGLKSADAAIEHGYATLRLFREHGIDIVAGTDSAAGLKGTAIGPSLWMELELYVEECGMTPLEALKSATSVTARRFGFADRGVVEEGKRADLLLVKGDPTVGIEGLWADGAISGVWKQGLRAV